MSRLVVLSLLLACRAEVEPVATPPLQIPEPRECADYTWRDEVWDCTALPVCEADLSFRLACCECDRSFCEIGGACPDPEFPPDLGPVIAFERAVEGRYTYPGPDTHILITPDLVVVAGDPTRAVQAVCARTNNTFTCEPVRLSVGLGVLVFDVFDLIVTDADADGVAEGGMLRVGGHYSGPMQASEITRVFAMSADESGADAELPDPVLPTRPLVLRLGELGSNGPVPALVAGDETRALEAVPGVVGVAAYRMLEGQPVLPWGAELTVDGALSDLSGNPVSVLASAVVADPGPWTDNPGFEGAGGWVTQGFEYPIEGISYPGFNLGQSDPEAWDGAQVAFSYDGGFLLGEAEIPEDASTVVFALRTDGYQAPAGTLTVVTPANERTVIWAFDPSQPVICEGSGGSLCLPWTVQTADITPWAGQSVYFELELRAAVDPAALTPFSPPSIRVAVDGFAFE